VHTRDSILHEIGPHWRLAVALSTLRWFFEFGVIISTLYGLSEHPDPALTLLAFTAASMLGLLPFTPGGLGFVEAGLTGTLALAGVSGASALVTTLVYRLLTFWLPLPIGAIAAIVFRRRYPRRNGHPSRQPAPPGGQLPAAPPAAPSPSASPNRPTFEVEREG
jgi:uncharacterized membrane protein YbhN (UPF0104 family)